MVEEMERKTQKQVGFGVTWDNKKKPRKYFIVKNL